MDRFFYSNFITTNGGNICIILSIRGKQYNGGRITINPYVLPLAISGYGSLNAGGNTLLQIHGSGFAEQGNKVYFVKNGIDTELEVSVETGTRITVSISALVPAGTYFIKVEHPNGRSVKSNFTFMCPAK